MYYISPSCCLTNRSTFFSKSNNLKFATKPIFELSETESLGLNCYKNYFAFIISNIKYSMSVHKDTITFYINQYYSQATVTYSCSEQIVCYDCNNY